MPGLPVVFTAMLPSGCAISVRQPFSTSVTPCSAAKLRASPTRSASTCFTVMPASRAISPGCGVSTIARLPPLVAAFSSDVFPASAFSASASITIGRLTRSTNVLTHSGVEPSCPSPGPIPTTEIPFSSVASVCSSSTSSDNPPEPSVASGVSINSGATAATIGRISRGTAAVTSPAPVRIAARHAIDGAPALPNAPPTNSTWPSLPLLPSTARGVSAIAFAAPAQCNPLSDWIALSSVPIGATTTGPNVLPIVRCPNACASLGATNVTTASARNAPSALSMIESASHPLGRSTATKGTLISASISRAATARPRRGGLNPVPTTASSTSAAPSSAARSAGSSPISCSSRPACLFIAANAAAASPFNSPADPSSATRTLRPPSARCRAATNPSPPLLPLPQIATTSPSPENRLRQNRATAAPAFSISTATGTPCSTDRLSAAAISAAVRIFMEIVLSS